MDCNSARIPLSSVIDKNLIDHVHNSSGICIDERVFLHDIEGLGIEALVSYETASAYNPKRATILASRMFWKIDPAAFAWASKHELGHIEDWKFAFITAPDLMGQCYNYIPTAGIISLIATRSIPKSFFSSALLYYFISELGPSFFLRSREYRADTFAIKNSSDEELRGGMRYFKFSQLKNEYYKKPFFSYFYSSHPSPVSRLKRIENEFVRRNGYLAPMDNEDQQIIDDLLTWHLWSTEKIKTQNYESFHQRYNE